MRGARRDSRLIKQGGPLIGAITARNGKLAIAADNRMPSHDPREQRIAEMRKSVPVEIIDHPTARGFRLHVPYKGD